MLSNALVRGGGDPSKVGYGVTSTIWLASPKSVHILLLAIARRYTSGGSIGVYFDKSGNVEYTLDIRDGREVGATKVSRAFTGDGTACGSCVNARCEENCEDRRDHFEVEVVDERSRRENNQKVVEVEQMEDREL
jgi:hypothetical protein